MADKIAVVTGSNKGIGYATVKELCKRGVSVVYLTARDVKRGLDAVERLKKEGFNPRFHQLEITDKNSVKTLAEYIQSEHGGLDILINNAAVIVNDFCKTTYQDAKRVIDVNYYSLFIIQEYLFPILKDNARVINISSDCGHISNLRNKYWIERLTNKNMKVEDINAFVVWFLDSVKKGTLNEDDFTEQPLLSYRISKIALSALTKIQQEQVGRNISINSLHPGFIQTDMTKGQGVISFEESGFIPTYLALDIDQSKKGLYFWHDKSEKDWADPTQALHGKFEPLETRLKKAGIF